MNAVLDWGIMIVLWLQQFSPALDWPFTLLSWLGEETSFMLLIPFIWWCVDKRKGAYLAVLCMVSFYINALGKALASQPRPFTYDSRVKQLYDATGGGFPSGHTQSTVTTWGYLMAAFKKRWITWLGIALMVLIPLSRLYLGVHFPTDLLGAYVIGAVVLALTLWLGPRVEPWFKGLSLPWQVGLPLAVGIILALVFPAGPEDGITPPATLAGLGMGLAMEEAFVAFQPAASWKRRLLAFALGTLVMMGLRFGLKALFEPLGMEGVLRFVRYTLMGLWGGLGAPWVFVKLGLAQPGKTLKH